MHLQQFDGVMIGREAYQNPWLLAELQRDIVDTDYSLPERAAVVLAYAAYVAEQCAKGERAAGVMRHILNLYNGLPRARAWRRFLSENAGRTTNPAQLLEDSLRIVESQAA
jgi:tRNA-dihydrouridine synthase A